MPRDQAVLREPREQAEHQGPVVLSAALEPRVKEGYLERLVLRARKVSVELPVAQAQMI